MYILTAAIILLLVALTAVLLYLARGGLFSKITVDEREDGPFLLVYKMHTGDYKNIGPVMDKVYYMLRDEYQLETTRGFGLYFDNPKETDKSQLRSLGGCIVDGMTQEQLENRCPGIKESLAVAHFPKSLSVAAEHPYKGMVSIILGVFRVYPRLEAWMRKYNRRSVPVMEIYDTPGRTITYLAAVDVPDAIFENLLNQGA